MVWSENGTLHDFRSKDSRAVQVSESRLTVALLRSSLAVRVAFMQGVFVLDPSGSAAAVAAVKLKTPRPPCRYSVFVLSRVFWLGRGTILSRWVGNKIVSLAT